MTDYYPGFIQDASGAYVPHPQAYQPIPGTTAGVDTGVILQGGVSYTPPAPAYTPMTPTGATGAFPDGLVQQPSILNPSTLTGGVQTTQVPLNTELGQYNPPGYISPLPQSPPVMYQSQPYDPNNPNGLPPTPIPNGGLGGGGVYGTVNSMSGTNQNVGQPSLYLQSPSTSTIGTNPGAIGAFNPAMYPNGISILPTNPNDPGSLQYLQAQAAATAAANPAPDARFLPGGMYYGQNPATVGVPLTGSVAQSIAQNPTAYPQTLVNTANQTVLQGGVSTTAPAGNTYINDNDLTNNTTNNTTNNSLALALGAHNMTPAQGPDLGALFKAINAPQDNNQRMPLIAQAPSDLVSDAVDPSPYQLIQDTMPPTAPAIDPRPNMQTQSWDKGGPYGYAPQRQYAPMMEPQQAEPLFDPRRDLNNIPRSIQQPDRPFITGIQQAQLDAAQSARLEPPPRAPRLEGSPGGGFGGFMQRLSGFNAANLTAQNQRNRQRMDGYASDMQSWTSRQNSADTTMREIANNSANNTQKNAEQEYNKAFELGKWMVERGTPSQEIQQKIREEITSTTAPGSPQRRAAIQGYYYSTGIDFSDLFNVSNQNTDLKREQDRLQNQGYKLDNEYKRRTMNDRAREQAANADKAQVDARVAKSTEQAVIAAKQLDNHAKELENQLNDRYAEPMKRAALQNQLEQTLMMKKNAAQAAFNGYQKSIQDYTNMQKEKDNLLINGFLDQAVQKEEEIQSIFGAREGGKDLNAHFIDSISEKLVPKDKKGQPLITNPADLMKLYDVASPAMQKQIDKAANLAFLKSGKTPTLLNGLRKSMDELRSEIAGYARQDVSKQMPAQAREFRAVPVQNLAPIAAGQKDRNGVVASEPEWMLWGDKPIPSNPIGAQGDDKLFITPPPPMPNKKKPPAKTRK